MHSGEAPLTDSALVALQHLVHSAAKLAEGLSVPDIEARSELLDALAIANLNVLRLREGQANEVT